MKAPEELTLSFERRIAASPETVFSFFVDPVKYVQWQGFEANLDPRPGGEYAVRLTETGGVRGRFVEVVPHSRIVYTWGWESRAALPPMLAEVPPGSSTVEVTLEPDGEGTLLRVQHLGLPEAAAGTHSMGWTAYLERLAIVSAGGDPGPDPIEQLRSVIMSAEG